MSNEYKRIENSHKTIKQNDKKIIDVDEIVRRESEKYINGK